MTVVSIFACVIVVWGLFARGSGSAFVAAVDRLRVGAGIARVCAVGLMPLYAGQLLLIAMQSRLENVAPEYAWMKTLPIPVFDDRADSAPLHLLFTTFGFGLGLLESAALAAVVIALRRRSVAKMDGMLAVSASVLGLLSLVAPVMASTDPYEFVAMAMHGFHSYVVHSGAFVHTAYEAYARHIPVHPVNYGPLWMAIDVAESTFGSSIEQKIEAIRVCNAVFVAATIWLLRRAGVSRAALAACALNPAVWYYAVANPHPEIEGFALFAGVYACAVRSKPILATLLLIAAGLVKLPFVVIGGVLLVPLDDAKRRRFLCLAACVLVVLISYLVPGPAYLATLWRYGAYGARTNWSEYWLAILPLVVIASALLVASRRGYLGVAWLFHQMAPLAAPWYLLWGIPYALASGSVELYLISLPLAATQAERMSSISAIVLFVVVVGFIVDNAVSRRRRLTAMHG